MTRAILALGLALAAAPLAPTPITPAEHAAIMRIADRVGVPRSIANWLQVEESGDRYTGAWGCAEAVGQLTAEGYRSLGLVQLYTEPGNLAWLIENYWTPFHPGEVFDIFNPLHNAEVGFRYLADLHRRFGTWERALWFYNLGRVFDVPAGVREYARRIIEAPSP